MELHNYCATKDMGTVIKVSGLEIALHRRFLIVLSFY